MITWGVSARLQNPMDEVSRTLPRPHVITFCSQEGLKKTDEDAHVVAATDAVLARVLGADFKPDTIWA